MAISNDSWYLLIKTYFATFIDYDNLQNIFLDCDKNYLPYVIIINKLQTF